MKKLLKLHARPKLRSPNLLAAWPGISNVAMIVATYLARKLDFKELAEVEASHFFDPIGVLVKNNVVESPKFPESRFYYWKNQPDKSDLILFIGEDQPGDKGYELANLVIDLGLRFGVKKIYTCAAALTRIHHTEKSKVWAAATNQQLAKDLLKEHALVRGGNFQISGLNGLLLGVAKERAIDGICLLGEVPSYTSRISNPMAATSVLEMLAKILGIEIDTSELRQQASAAQERMSQVAAEAMEEYIDYFTEPIWESGDSEDDEEE